MANDDQMLITAEEAESLLPKGDTIHNFVNSPMVVLGCDFSRADAIKAFREAKSIEIGGDNCKALKHPIVVFDHNNRHSFFAADMEKVEAFEIARGVGGESQQN